MVLIDHLCSVSSSLYRANTA